MNSLSGKRALVTGAASGIGLACATALRNAGAEVVGLDLRPQSTDFRVLACDLSDEAQVIAAVAEAARIMGKIDILVNNAGILEERPLVELNAAHIDRMFAVNVRGAMLVAREATPHLPEGGRIINIVSELALLGRANASVYVATKAAMIGATRSWARELAPRILVNAVAPGPTDTPLLGFDQLDARAKAEETANPLGRIGQPAEVANAVVFLAGPGSTLFTGQCLGANGGAAMN
ncbi:MULTISPECIES: SDR family NAD(P)-dependent oxidoreductase [Paracoccus]|uniref:SDR family NAD(P)-dependent oxidoreductase n=1 Tax=Paracoccus TaxID=265 RepID=UPI001F054B8E|nr:MULTISPECIES: SDR family oxidoreductase [Paracoccus]